jgi:hypothetical protein
MRIGTHPGVVVRAWVLSMVCFAGVSSAGPLRSLTVEDILEQESFGRIEFAAHGNALVFERTAAPAHAANIVAVGLSEGTGPLRKIYVIDLRGDKKPKLLFDQLERGGYWLGERSEDQSRYSIFSMVDGMVRAGVVEVATGAVIWFDFTPDYSQRDGHSIWISNDELIYQALPPGEQPSVNYLPGAIARLDSLRAAPIERSTASATVLISNSAGTLASSRDGRLLLANARTGGTVTLEDGRFSGFKLSPGGRYLAVSHEVGLLQPPRPTQGGFFYRWLQPQIIDLQTRAVTTVACGSCTLVSPQAFSWSDDSRILLAAIRTAGTRTDDQRILRVTIDGNAGPTLEEILLPDYWRRSNLLMWYLPSAIGISGKAVVFAPSGPPLSEEDRPSPPCYEQRCDAFLVQPGLGPINLTAGIRDAAGFSASRDGRIEVQGSAANWLVALNGAKEKVSAPADRNANSPAAGALLAATASDGRSAAFTLLNDGVTQLILTSRAMRPTTVVSINEHLKAVGGAHKEKLSYQFHGKTLTSCILLPWNRRPDERLPTILSLYPDVADGSCSDGAIGENGPDGELLAGHGFAVLYVANPPRLHRDKNGPEQNTGALASAAADAAVSQGYADPQRLGLFGESQGYHTVLQVLTQTDRFKAAVAMNGMSDFVSAYGTVGLTHELISNYFFLGLAGRFEDPSPVSSNGLGAAPWENPERYIANSPALHADRIQTPLLLVHNEFDGFNPNQSQEMFSALSRLRRDAQYVKYWGEGHDIRLPANIRDYWRRVFEWFDSHFEQAEHENAESHIH